jgi:MoaA/NifB/PqqE/SkfB family radical SAM enzyme
MPFVDLTAGFLAHDLVLSESACNLTCSYCLTGQSVFKQEHERQLIFKTPTPVDAREGTEKWRAITTVERNTRLAGCPPILKITGGEVLLARGIDQLVEMFAVQYAVFVLQTNAVLLDSVRLQRFCQHPNFVLQVSLDATDYEANRDRVSSEAMHRRILTNLTNALDAGVPVEIYLVLTNRSAPALARTLEFFRPWSGHVVVFPFPVRGPSYSKWYPGPESLRAAVTACEALMEVDRKLLPPPAYLRGLVEFLRSGQRERRCHLPRFAFTSFDDGIVTPCPNIWFSQIGNALKQPAHELLEHMAGHGIYRVLLGERPRLEACRRCFTPWDMLSMFLDGEIALDELCTAPIYRDTAVRRRLIEIQQITAGYKFQTGYSEADPPPSPATNRCTAGN